MLHRCRAWVPHCYLQPPGGTGHVVLLQRTGLELQALCAMCERMHRLPELLAAKSFASHTAIIPGTPPGPEVPQRSFRTQGETLALLNRHEEDGACTSSEHPRSPPLSRKAAYAAHKLELVLIGMPRAHSWVAMII